MHWRTKDGKYIPVKELDDNHLCNTISMFEDNYYYQEEVEPDLWHVLLDEQARRRVAAPEGNIRKTMMLSDLIEYALRGWEIVCLETIKKDEPFYIYFSNGPFGNIRDSEGDLYSLDKSDFLYEHWSLYRKRPHQGEDK